MKYVLLILLLSIFFSSCAVIDSVMGWNKCAQSGCDREKVKNCNYCGFHCESYSPPEGFNRQVSKSIDEQVKRSQKEYKNNSLR